MRVRVAISCAALAATGAAACGGSEDLQAPPPPEPPADEDPGHEGPEDPVVISVMATTDTHGHIEALPVLGGYFDSVRAARADDGGVVLVDSGDIFQGTLESNLNQGEAAIAAYNALGYDAVAIGNHEFDFGPAHEAHTPQDEGDDPRGALKARAREAEFPMLAANVAVEDGPRVDWENAPASAVVSVDGVDVGIIGVTTIVTPRTTIATNFEGLEVWPLLPTVRGEARALRSRGADVIVLAAHAGGRCADLEDPSDLTSCDMDDEIFELARGLPRGLVDVIAAGHTHAAVAHRVGDTAIVQAYANGVGFGRVDLTVRPDTGDVEDLDIHPPVVPCRDDDGAPVGAHECEHDTYAGVPVEVNARAQVVVDEAIEAAERARTRSLGVAIAEPLEAGYASESPLGNLFADLMLEAMPEADVALTNSGGVRADLPAGELTYGELHRAVPFDNRLSRVSLTADDLAVLLRDNLEGSSGILLLAGVRGEARCDGGDLEVEIYWPDGRPVAGERELVVATSDFLAPGGGRGLLGSLDLPEDAVEVGAGGVIRSEKAELLGEREEPLGPDEVYDPNRPRLAYPGQRPVECE